MATAIAIKELDGLKGKLIGTSKWMKISQKMINSFADCTEDHQFIHVDEKRAKEEAPFGGIIAHGFLSLSLLTKLSSEISVKIKGTNLTLNYGFNKVRFVHPVKVNQKVRAKFILLDYAERSSDQWMLVYDIMLEIENEKKPALVAEWLTLQIVS